MIAGERVEEREEEGEVADCMPERMSLRSSIPVRAFGGDGAEVAVVVV